MKLRPELMLDWDRLDSGVAVLPAIFFGRSDKAVWLYVSFLRGRIGVMVRLT